MLVPVPAQRSDDRDRRLDHGREAVLVQPVRPGRSRRLAPPRLGRDVRLPGNGTPLPLLDPLAQRRPVELAPAVEPAVIHEHLRRQDVEEVVTRVSALRGQWRLDEHGAETTAGVRARARSPSPRRRRGRPRRRAERRPSRTPASGRAVPRRAASGGRAVESALGTSPIRPRHRRQQQPAVGERARHRAGVVEAPGESGTTPVSDTRAPGRLDRRGAAAGGRDAERSRRLGPGGGGNHVRRERRAPSRRSSRRRSARAPTGCRPDPSCRRRRTRACAGGRGAPSRPQPGGARRHSPPSARRRAGGSTQSPACPATPYRSLSPSGIPVNAGAGPSRRTPASRRRSSARAATATASSS